MSQALRELIGELQAEPPQMDDLRRARLERKLLGAVEEGAHLDVSSLSPSSLSPSGEPGGRGAKGRRLPPWAIAGGGMALAVAAALLLIFWPRPPAEELVVRPELRFSVEDTSGAGRRGTLDPGAALHTEGGRARSSRGSPTRSSSASAAP